MRYLGVKPVLILAFGAFFSVAGYLAAIVTPLRVTVLPTRGFGDVSFVAEIGWPSLGVLVVAVYA